MKNIFKFLLAGVLAAFLAACSDKPSDVAMNYTEELFDGGKNLSEFIYIGDKKLSKDEEQMLNGKLTMVAGMAAEKAKESGGFKKAEVVSEDIAENTAKVILKWHFKDGSSSNENFNLIKSSDGWKVSLE